MKTLTIIGGVDGVGKTSMSGVLLGRRNIRVIIDADFTDEETAEQQINAFIKKGIDFTLETTLSDSYILETIKTARDNNYYIRLYYIAVSTAEESIRRIRNRVRKGGHNVSNDIVLTRFKHRFDDLIAILPYCNETFIYDNENGFVEKAEYGNGRLVIKDNDIPEWLAELKKKLTEEAI